MSLKIETLELAVQTVDGSLRIYERTLDRAAGELQVAGTVGARLKAARDDLNREIARIKHAEYDAELIAAADRNFS